MKTQGRTLVCPFNFRPLRIVVETMPGGASQYRCEKGNRTAVAGGAFHTTLGAGSQWWSSGGNTRDKWAHSAGQPTQELAGDCPQDQRVPTQELDRLPLLSTTAVEDTMLEVSRGGPTLSVLAGYILGPY